MYSEGFQRLYCDPAVLEPFSSLHPISFAGVLPFQSDDPVLDDPGLLGAEAAHLAAPNELTRREVIDAYARCGLLSAEEAANVISVIDFYGADFFELMGLIYANAGMYICALRWYREFIRALEVPRPDAQDEEGVHASVGYCLYALGLFAEAITWTKSCAGSELRTDRICQALMDREAEQAGGRILAVERGGRRTRYTISASDPAQAGQNTSRIIAALAEYAPSQQFYIEWVAAGAPLPGIPAEGCPFRVDINADDLPRHKMNLLFALCGQADALVETGHSAEARRWLSEAALVEPAADFIRERLGFLA
jgi:tetratricopeptide (TPR) repeat protein